MNNTLAGKAGLKIKRIIETANEYGLKADSTMTVKTKAAKAMAKAKATKDGGKEKDYIKGMSQRVDIICENLSWDRKEWLKQEIEKLEFGELSQDEVLDKIMSL